MFIYGIYPYDSQHVVRLIGYVFMCPLYLVCYVHLWCLWFCVHLMILTRFVITTLPLWFIWLRVGDWRCWCDLVLWLFEHYLVPWRGDDSTNNGVVDYLVVCVCAVRIACRILWLLYVGFSGYYYMDVGLCGYVAIFISATAAGQIRWDPSGVTRPMHAGILLRSASDHSTSGN